MTGRSPLVVVAGQAATMPSGDDLNFAGAAYTPFAVALTPGSGTFSNATAAGWYRALGKTIFVRIRINIGAVGSATGILQASGLPFKAAGTANGGVGDCHSLAGTEAQSGFALWALIIAQSQTVSILKFDGSSAIGNNYTFQINGSYESV